MGLVVLLGGARSGKSRLAVTLARASAAPVTIVVTAEGRDEEMRERIAAHRVARPAEWRTVEEPLELEPALAAVPPADTLVVDCLSFWVANVLERGDPAVEVVAAAERSARLAAGRNGLTVAVSNEVGLGVVPASAIGRAYRDLLGSVNRTWAEAAAHAAFVVAGRVLRLVSTDELLAATGVGEHLNAGADEHWLDELASAIPQLDEVAARAAAAELDRKTKPRGSLGRLEELALRLAAIRAEAVPAPLRPVIVVASGDHGVTAEGVSAYPQEVTRQMLLNFISGGAAVCVLARAAGAELLVVDAGTAEPLAHPAVRDLRIGSGTANATRGPAMSRAQATDAVRRGAALAAELAGGGATLFALGDMGIGNTTASAAVVAALLGREPASVCGPGTGLDNAGVEHKADVVARMLARNQPDREDALAVLAAVGGFELGVLAGVILGAAAARAVVLLDGLITGAAALVAVRLAPVARGYLVAAHRSPEPGHGVVLEELALEPLLDLRLRLGEGSGAALALPIVAAARAVLAEMATFAEAGVTDTGR